MPINSDECKEILDSSETNIDDIIDTFEMLEMPLKIIGTPQKFITHGGENASYIVPAFLNKSDEYHICYGIQFEFRFDSIINKFDVDPKKLNDILLSIVNINDKVEKLCDRIERSKNVKIKILNRMEKRGTAVENPVDNFLVVSLSIVENKKISGELITKSYDKWQNSKIITKLNDAMDMVHKMYVDRGITNPDIIFNEATLEWDDTDSVPIGLSTEDEIIVVATYSKKNHTTVIDKNEFERSVRELNYE